MTTRTLKKIGLIFKEEKTSLKTGEKFKTVDFECINYFFFDAGVKVVFEDAVYTYPWHSIDRIKEYPESMHKEEVSMLYALDH